MTHRQDLIEELEHLDERICEFSAEMANERAMFGDSGPGTWLRLSEMKARAAELDRLINATWPEHKAKLNVTREQWKKAWRDARCLVGHGREPKQRSSGAPNELIWHAFNLVDNRPWHRPTRTARDRLQWQRTEVDIPF